MFGWERVFKILASSSNLSPNCDMACLLFTFLTAHGDLNLLPAAGDLSYRKTLTPVPYPSFVRKGVAGRCTEGELQMGVEGGRREIFLVFAGVKGALILTCVNLFDLLFFTQE